MKSCSSSQTFSSQGGKIHKNLILDTQEIQSINLPLFISPLLPGELECSIYMPYKDCEYNIEITYQSNL